MSHGLNAAELEDIRSSYEEELAGLTFNSKPIINMLTTIAQENMNAAAVICKTIEDRIRSAPPHQKLPVMYLLDSISKNVGSPFTPIFGRNLYKTYMDCYTVVDSNTRRSLEALFSTWKLPVAGSNSPVPVYPVDDTRRIDEALLRMRAVQDRNPMYAQYAQPPSRYNSASPFPQSSYPGYPPMYADQMQDVYRQSPPVQFRQSPEAPFRPQRNPAADAIIQDIGGLLRTLDTRARLNPEDATTLRFLTSLRGLHDLLTTQDLRPMQLEEVRNSLREVAAFCAQPVRPMQNDAQTAFMQAGGLQAPPMDLFAQLAKAGMLPASGSNTPLSIPLFQPPQPTGVYIELSSNAMLQSRPELIDVLYSSMPLQCYQCGQRWHDAPAERALKDEHLDWHFKTNKRLREHSVRSQSRALYLTETEWINFSLSDDGALEHSGETVKAIDHSASTVPKPSDPALHDSHCPICKESFDTDWNDANEQWVWKNAIDVQGTVYHATCHAETLAAQKKSNETKVRVKGEAKVESDIDAGDAMQEANQAKEEEEEEEEEDIALPGTGLETSQEFKTEPGSSGDGDTPLPPPAEAEEGRDDDDDDDDGRADSKSPTTQDFSAAIVPPVSLEDALKSLSGTLSALNGTKRKASEDGDDGSTEERRIKSEPE